MSIVRIGIGENEKFAEGYDAIFGKKKKEQAKQSEPEAKPSEPEAKPAKPKKAKKSKKK